MSVALSASSVCIATQQCSVSVRPPQSTRAGRQASKVWHGDLGWSAHVASGRLVVFVNLPRVWGEPFERSGLCDEREGRPKQQLRVVDGGECAAAVRLPPIEVPREPSG
jgi:hypothetical protein